MNNIIIGTAGHIDHGKTTLIKALTGIETDTTTEEKERGLSINIGFAYLDLPNGDRVGIVDVPGHEKFIKNMLAGVAGINLVLLVIDANEGIMPQTKEHIDILTLLGIEDFIVVLTKISMIDEELRELVYEDIQEQLIGSSLESAQIIEVDSLAGIGLEELRQAISKKTQKIQLNMKESSPRLNVDRVFSAKGFGTIVTGTLLDGTVHVGDELMIYPSEKKAKIRSIQVHKEGQKQAFSGQRTALNLTRISMNDIKRGDVLTVKGNVEPTWMIDAKVTVLPLENNQLKQWDRVHLHIGTSEVRARIVPLGVNEIAGGSDGFVQLRLEDKIAVKQGDHFIIRSYSPMVTIAGGVVLEANATKHRRFNQETLASLKVKEIGDFDEMVLDYLRKPAINFATAKEIGEYLNENVNRVKDTLDDLLEEKRVFVANQGFISMDKLEELMAVMKSIITDYHQNNSLKKGMPIEEFRSRFNALRKKEIEMIVYFLMEREEVVVSHDVISMADFKVIYSPAHQKEKERIEKTLLQAGLLPPSIPELLHENKIAEEVLVALEGETIFYLNQETIIHMAVYQKAVKKVREFIEENGEITLAEFRDMMHTSRKYSMIFLEHLDEMKITKRLENSRILAV